MLSTIFGETVSVFFFAMFFLLLSEIIQDAHKVGLKLTHFLFGETGIIDCIDLIGDVVILRLQTARLFRQTDRHAPPVPGIAAAVDKPCGLHSVQHDSERILGKAGFFDDFRNGNAVLLPENIQDASLRTIECTDAGRLQ